MTVETMKNNNIANNTNNNDGSNNANSSSSNSSSSYNNNANNNNTNNNNIVDNIKHVTNNNNNNKNNTNNSNSYTTTNNTTKNTSYYIPKVRSVELSEIFYITRGNNSNSGGNNSNNSSGNSQNKKKNRQNNNNNSNNVKIQVKLTAEGVFLRRETDKEAHVNEQLIRIEDIIGSRCGQQLKKRRGIGFSSCRTGSKIEEPGDEPRTTTPKNGTKSSTIAEAQGDQSAYLYIYAYVKKEQPLRRTRTVRILRFRNYNRYIENLKVAERWHRGIEINKLNSLGLSRGIPNMERKPLLMLINPKSGKGNAREMFQRQVAPVLKEADIPFDLQVTPHANYARDFVYKREDLCHKYSGIVVASGDGLFHEILNGLMLRPDWREVSRLLPLGIIPCGSGNGLAKTISHLYQEPYDPKPVLNSMLTCVSGRTTPMDIVRVELAEKNPNKPPIEMYSFLSVGWGLLADIDIESERLRSIGSHRFFVWTFHRLISLRKYKGRLSYLPWHKEDIEKTTDNGVEDPQTTSNGLHTSENIPIMPNNNEDYHIPQTSSRSVSPQKEEKYQELPVTTTAVPSNAEFDVGERALTTAGPQNNCEEFVDAHNDDDDNDDDDNGNFEKATDDDDDDFFDAISLGGISHRTHLDSWRSVTSRQTAYYSIAGQSIRSRRSIISAKLQTVNNEELAETPTQLLTPPASTLPPLNIPLNYDDDAWRYEDGEFILVQAAYTSHIASDVHFAPQSTLNDGIIYLVIIRAGASRSQILQFLWCMSSGTHLPTEPNEFIEVIPVRAFRIEPAAEQDGIITVDGERVEYGPVQCEILPGLINVMVPNVPNEKP